MQGGQRRGGGRGGGGEPRTPTSRRDLDVNRERLIFCVSSLVGHRVTAKLRNNIIYEGLFHSCSLDGDWSISLKHARRLPSEDSTSGEVINTLVIPGKDFLQVSAVDVPLPCEQEDELGAIQNSAFTLDSDIAARRNAQAGRERELVPWSNGDGGDAAIGGLEDGGGGNEASWDQFAVNENRFNVVSTFREELYTTPLDPSTIPRSKREEAERIAKEIENGQQNADVEGKIDMDGGDEEDMWSAVGRRRAEAHMLVSSGSSGPNQKVPPVPLPLTKEFLSQHDSLQIPAEGLAREHRAKRSLITAHSPMKSPMVSEMKRINALNLEPALPKLDEKTRNDWINFKQSSKPALGVGCLKTEFQQSLEAFQKWENKQQWQHQQQSEGSQEQGDGGARGGKSQQSGQVPDGTSSQGGGSKPFTFNAGAASFTPSGMNTALSPAANSQAPATGNGSSGGQTPMRKAPAPAASQFTPQGNADICKKNLDQLLTPFLDRAKGQKTETQGPDWPQAKGPPYREVLGQPSQTTPMPPAISAMSGAAGGPVPANGWQPQAQNQMGGTAPPVNMAAPMMPQGFIVQGQTAGQPPPMYQMYAGPTGPVAVRPQGPGQGTAPQQTQGQPQQQTQGQPQQQQQPQQPQQQQPQQPQQQQHQPQQPQQQPMVFNQQGMMGQPAAGSMQMAGNMAQAVGQAPGGVTMGAMAPQGKYGGQPSPTMVVPLIMPANQYGGPGFTPGQVQTGTQPNAQACPQGPCPCQQGVMPQPMYQRPPMPGGQMPGGGQMDGSMSGHGG